MKKFFTLFLSACIFAGICTGCASNTSSWSKEDFSFYTENKKEIAFPTDDTEPSLKKINEEQNGNFQTYRGVQIGDRASDAFAKYDMNNFYYSVTNKWGNSSVSDEYADKTDLEFHEKYPNFADASQHLDELSPNVAVFIGMVFFVEDNGQLTKAELTEKGNVANNEIEKDRYYIYFIVQDQKIIDIQSSFRKG